MKRLGTLCGIGIGPGDPDLITIKGAKLLADAGYVIVPKGGKRGRSLALEIVKPHLPIAAKIREITFPMSEDDEAKKQSWEGAAREALSILSLSQIVCFPTLGDPSIYSTFIYLVRAIREIEPGVDVVTVPGINSFSAAAAKAGFILAEDKEALTIIPAKGDLSDLKRALRVGGKIVIMKIGRALSSVISLLEEYEALEDSVFISHLGLEDERIVKDLSLLKAGNDEAGYLSIILTQSKGGKVA